MSAVAGGGLAQRVAACLGTTTDAVPRVRRDYGRPYLRWTVALLATQMNVGDPAAPRPAQPVTD
jgi:hypothetical protein